MFRLDALVLLGANEAREPFIISNPQVQLKNLYTGKLKLQPDVLGLV